MLRNYTIFLILGGSVFAAGEKKLGFFLGDLFDNFMLNFFVAFLFEGTKFKVMTFFSVRGCNKASKARKYRGKGGFNDSNGSLSTILSTI